jgi:hypothetical protein
MKLLAHRLKEPSSWAAIFAALAALGISLDAGLTQQITAAGAGVAGLLAFFLPEQSGK